jgi:hypothetical protein
LFNSVGWSKIALQMGTMSFIANVFMVLLVLL